MKPEKKLVDQSVKISLLQDGMRFSNETFFSNYNYSFSKFVLSGN
jgi:hypothetical protein